MSRPGRRHAHVFGGDPLHTCDLVKRPTACLAGECMGSGVLRLHRNSSRLADLAVGRACSYSLAMQ
jgi:hypothetical protein